MKVYVLESIDDDKYEEVLADTLFNGIHGTTKDLERIFEDIMYESEMSEMLSETFEGCGLRAFIQYALLSPRVYKSIGNYVKRFEKSVNEIVLNDNINNWIRLFPNYESERVAVIARFLNITNLMSDDEYIDVMGKVLGSWAKSIYKQVGSYKKITFQEIREIHDKQIKKDGIPKDIDELTMLAVYMGLIAHILSETSDTFEDDRIVFGEFDGDSADAIIVKMVNMFSMDWYVSNVAKSDKNVKPRYFKVPDSFRYTGESGLAEDNEYHGLFGKPIHAKYLALLLSDLIKTKLKPYPTNYFYTFNKEEIELLNVGFENLWNVFFDNLHFEKGMQLNEEDFYYFSKMLLVYLLPLISDLNKSREMFIFEDSKKDDINKKLNEEITDIKNQLSSSKQTIGNLNKKLEEKDKALAQFDVTKIALADAEEEKDKLLQRIKELEEQLESDVESKVVAEDFTKTDGYKRLYDYINSKEVSIIGGWGNWIKKIRVELPNVKFYEPERLNKSLDSIKKDKLVIFNSSANNHGMYYQVKNILKDTNIPMIYIPTQSSNFEMVMYNLKNELDKNGIEY